MRNGETPREWHDRMENEKYWRRYYALPFREKVRSAGLACWLTNTNAGVLVSVLAISVAGVLALLAMGAWT